MLHLGDSNTTPFYHLSSISSSNTNIHASYFDKLSYSTAMERHPLFIQTNAELFQSEPLPTTVTTAVPIPTLSSSSSPTTPATSPMSPSIYATLCGSDSLLQTSDIHLRRERQTFTPLPLATAQTGRKTVLFSVRTYLIPLQDVSTAEIEALVDSAHSWADDTAEYKGREHWITAVVAYLAERKRREAQWSLDN